MNLNLIAAALFLCYQLIQGAELTEDSIANTDTNDESLSRVRRAGLSMLRLGRGLQMLRLGKRGLPMLRLGRSVGDSYSPSDRYFWSRQVPLPRYGKDLELQYLLLNALKNGDLDDLLEDSDRGYNYGYDFETTPERQIRPAPRPGMRYKRSTDTMNSELEKDPAVRAPPLARYGKETEGAADKELAGRVAPLMRYGKHLYDDDSSDYDDDEIDATAVKRAMRMLRLGRGMRMLRLGKRPMDSDDMSETDKRAMRMLRLGKRPFKMLRLGRSNNEDEKRALRLLRLGKRSDAENMS